MSIPDTNNQTLQTYEAKLREYIDSTPQQINDVEIPWIDQALNLIPKKGRVLELGSGFGRNASYIQQQGYAIECTEAVKGFVDILNEKGFNARFLNALTDDFGTDYDMVFANGVLVHFTPDEAADALDKSYSALAPNGIFAFSVKEGQGSEWTNEKLDAPRFFHYWQQEDIKNLVITHGFEWITILEGKTSSSRATWLYIIARKVAK